MSPAARFQFERAAREFAQWRAVPEDERSPAAAWWWATAMSARNATELMPPLLCQNLELAEGSSYAAGAEIFIAAIAGQAFLPWPDQFPREYKPRSEEPQATS
jgi:hypothetical protein